jgi:integrase
MATIRKRGSSWQVQIRREGFPPISKTFAAHADAVAWARDKERAIDRAELPPNHRDLKAMTVGTLLNRYEQEVTPKKRGADRERFKLRVIRSYPIAQASLDKLSGAMVASYRDDRLRVVSSGTVRRELAVLQHCLEIARKEWDVPLINNPVRQITLPEHSKPRERRLTPDDIKTFWLAVERARAAWVKPLIVLAIETGMRRGELLSIDWQDIDLEARLVRLSRTKNGHPRAVPLTQKAIETLSSMEMTHGLVFPLKPYTVRQAWVRLVERGGIEGLRLHDLRHEAVSRFFEYGLTVPEVALISGHRDPRMLSRYTHLRPEKVAEKLAKATT